MQLQQWKQMCEWVLSADIDRHFTDATKNTVIFAKFLFVSAVQSKPMYFVIILKFFCLYKHAHPFSAS